MAERKSRWKLILTVITFLALAGLIYATRKQVIEAFHNLAHVHAWLLVLMIPIQILDYDANAKLYQSMFRLLGEKLRYRSMYRLSLELNFVNTVFPSAGVSGFSYLSARLKPEGVSPAKTSLVQLMRFTLTFISFQVMLFFGLLLLAAGGKANRVTILVSGVLATLVFIMTIGIIFIVGSRKRINGFLTAVTKVLNRLIRVIRTKHPETINIERARQVFDELHENYMILKSNYGALKKPLIFALYSNLMEILTIYIVYLAFGRLINPGAVIIAYAVANFAGILSVLPGGVGIYEALMTGVLVSAGVPAGISLPVTVMYRVINMGLQLPPGYYYYYKNLHSSKAHATV